MTAALRASSSGSATNFAKIALNGFIVLYVCGLLFAAFADFVPAWRKSAVRRGAIVVAVERILWTLQGAGNYWLFAPDPASGYLHATVCAAPVGDPEAPAERRCPRVLFKSYPGEIRDELDASRTSPTRRFRLVENLLDMGQRTRLLDDFGAHYRNEAARDGEYAFVLRHELDLRSFACDGRSFVSEVVWPETNRDGASPPSR